MEHTVAHDNYWSRPVDELMQSLGSNRKGLDDADAKARLLRYGSNTIAKAHGRRKALLIFLDRFRNPMVLILVFAATVSFMVQEWLDAIVVLTIVLVTALLSFIQEHRATGAVERLRKSVSVKASVIRGGRNVLIPSDEVVPGDIIQLATGSLIAGDGVLLEANNFYINQALLTGETYPVLKQPGTSPANATIGERNNCIFMGTSVRSGTATALVVSTGTATSFGQIADSLAQRPPETEFERGLRQFGTLLVGIMVVMVLAIMLINIALQVPTLETFMFAIALAVGMSPEMLPAILTITLARGAQTMARRGVIVKRLNAIENLGSMDVLCTDKTGTLTKGDVKLQNAFDVLGQPSTLVLQQAFLNASMQTGLVNPLDEAIITAGVDANIAIAGYQKLDEIPYDFNRKRLSVVVGSEQDATATMISKGALQNILDICSEVQDGANCELMTKERYEKIQKLFSDWSVQGFRVLGVAQKSVLADSVGTGRTEEGMVFTGFLLFFDPPEEEVRKTLDELQQLGVQLKIITGDNRHVASYVAETVGINVKRIITGAELAGMKDEALWNLAPEVSLFAEVDPNQKERIIIALQKSRHVVGYLGDGINDAPALHTADVGISVDRAVDVAKEAADFVLLEHDLSVICRGIREGRHIFANTMKYIFITTSANFGNMISMALASMFLPFLPLLAKQILLNNFLTDIPAMGLSGDYVDRNWEIRPHRWDIRLVRNFMITFGLISAMFDLLTFGMLWYLVNAKAELFQSGWFVESVLTELVIVFVIRSYQPFYKSKAGTFLTWSSVGVFIATLGFVYLPVGATLGFVPLPALIMLGIFFITGLYVMVSEISKRIFFRRFGM